jgi:Na+-translocating ferredoxin:NAD+ oxidoreductase subunit B
MAASWQAIHALLPQTQCQRCKYPDCEAYARAIVTDEAGINQCPPGGQEGIERLAALTGKPVTPLNPDHGMEGPRQMAWVDETWCIGCTLCIAVCPTDAIVGTNKAMHTVVERHCTGCELCIPACPVDCIHLEPIDTGLAGWAAWSKVQADSALERYTHRAQRIAA